MSPHSKFNVSSLTINPQKSREVDWELLPPEQNEKHTSLETPFRWLATIMDGLFRAPGTKYRFGLNPLIDFLPVVGDLGAAFVSFSVLLYALTRGLPKILLARMGLNLLVNELVGVVPVLGSAFALWFRANKRNYDLLQRHIALPSRSHKSDWIFVGAILAVIFAAILTGLAVTVVALRAFADLLSRS